MCILAFMTLSDYLHKQRESQRSFARRAGIHESTISRVLHGERDMMGEQWAKVHVATRGRVKPIDHYPVELAVRS